MIYSSKYFGIFLIAIFSYSTSLAQENTVTIEPAKPKPGKAVTITYHPDNPSAAIQSPDSLTLVFSFAPYMYNQPDEMKANKTADGWETTFDLPDEFSFASYYFRSGDALDKDSNNHDFELYAYEDGKPVTDAFLMKARSLSRRYSDAPDSVLSQMKAELYKKEMNYHPKNYDAQISLLANQLTQDKADTTSILKKAYKIIEEKLSDNPTSYIHVSDIKGDYRKLGKKAMGDSVEQALIDKYPNSDLAMEYLYRDRKEAKNDDEKAEILLKYINADYKRSIINKYHTELAYKQLFEYYAKQGDLEMAKRMAKKWIDPQKPLLENQITSRSFNDAAEILIEYTEWYDLAMDYALEALQKTDQGPAWTVLSASTGRVPRYLPEKRSQELKDRRKSNILTTIGRIYQKKEDYLKAEEYYSKAKELTDLERTQKLTAELYMKTKRPKQAYDQYWDILMDEPTDKESKKALKQAYIAFNGSKEGFKEETAELDEAWRNKMLEKFKKERLDEETPSLESVTNLQGESLDTSTLKDKIVIVDFWATWCGPCKAAFPYLQKVYEKYEDNSDVKFVVLNSAWNNTIKEARKWRQKQDYTFPTYYDKDSKVTEAFEVHGIPHTFVIGKGGNIQFEERGFHGPTMEPKLKLQIEMLLAENQNSSSSSSK